MKSKWWLPIVCFLAGLAVGILAVRTNPVLPITETRPVVSELAQFQAAPTGAPSTSPSVKAIAPAGPKPAYRDRLTAIADLNSLMHAKVYIPLLSSGKVNEDFVKIYNLTASDVARLEASVVQAKKSIAILEAKYAIIEPTGDNGFSISIPPFPQDGGVVYNALLDSFHEVLGDERFAAYRASANDLDSTWFGLFGLSKTNIVLRSTKDPDVSTSTMSSDGNGGGPMKFQVNTNQVFFPREYPELYQKLVAAGLWTGATHE